MLASQWDPGGWYYTSKPGLHCVPREALIAHRDAGLLKTQLLTDTSTSVKQASKRTGHSCESSLPMMACDMALTEMRVSKSHTGKV